MLRKHFLSLGTAATMAFVYGCPEDDGGGGAPPAVGNLLEKISDEKLDALAKVAKDLGLEDTLKEDEYTVFGPTDAAFEDVGTTFESDKLLTNVILYHLVADDTLSSDEVTSGDAIMTAANWPVSYGNDLLSGVELDATKLDIEASNGVLHVAKGVLVPPTIYEAAKATEDLSDLAGALDTADNAPVAALKQALEAKDDAGEPLTTLGDDAAYTLFAPNNDAFTAYLNGADLPAGIGLERLLEYHIVPGQVLAEELTDGATLTTLLGVDLKVKVADGNTVLVDVEGNEIAFASTDIRLKNGVVHVLSGVLNYADAELRTVVEIAEAEGYTTLVTLLADEGFDTVLNEKRADFTLFAPPNDAIPATPPAGYVVSNILLHHVITGEELASADMTKDTSYTTAANTTITVTSDDPLELNSTGLDPDALDKEAVNGVVHGLSGILLPPSLQGYLSNRDDLSKFDGAIDQLAEDTTYTVFAPNNTAVDAYADALDGEYHVVVGPQALPQAGKTVYVDTESEGNAVAIKEMDGEYYLTANNNPQFKVLEVVRLLNGVVYVIDQVLDPTDNTVPAVLEEKGYAKLLEGLGGYALDVILSDLSTLFTVFAPQDDAFADDLLQDQDQLENILLHHGIVGKAVEAKDLTKDASFETAAGTTITVDVDADTTSIGGAKLDADTALDIAATNGIIHGLGTTEIMIPPTVAEYLAANHASLATAIADTADVALPEDQTLTVIAPTDAAIAAVAAADVTAEVLAYHVLSRGSADEAYEQFIPLDGDAPIAEATASGELLTLSYDGGIVVSNGADGDDASSFTVVKTIRLKDGVVHVIEGVLTPPPAAAAD